MKRMKNTIIRMRTDYGRIQATVSFPEETPIDECLDVARPMAKELRRWTGSDKVIMSFSISEEIRD